MILYFTGTGNSRYVAKQLATKLEDTIISLNDLIKNNKENVFTSEKPFVMVAPIYAWRIPIIIEEVMKQAEFKGTNQIYVIATMGLNSGNTDRYVERICTEKGMEFMGYRGICMPSNYILADEAPTELEIKETIQKADVEIEEIAQIIRNHKKIEKTDRTPLSALKSTVINPFFNKYATSTKNYVVSSACSSCGWCERNCAVNNISMRNETPIFGDGCIGCLGCINGCPKRAIDVKGKTEKRGRYYLKSN